MNKIYNFEKGIVEVYNIIPNEVKIKKFKKQETETIRKDERILTRNDSIGWFSKKENYPVLLEAFGLEKENPKKVADIEVNEELLNRYVNGEINGYRLKRFQRHNNGEINGYRLKKFQRHDNGEPLYSLEIEYSNKYIQLSKREYELELLKYGLFNSKELLNEDDLSFLDTLITIPDNPEAKLDFPTLVLYHNSGLISDEFDSTLGLIESSSKVYKKIRKKK